MALKMRITIWITGSMNMTDTKEDDSLPALNTWWTRFAEHLFVAIAKR